MWHEFKKRMRILFFGTTYPKGVSSVILREPEYDVPLLILYTNETTSGFDVVAMRTINFLPCVGADPAWRAENEK